MEQFTVPQFIDVESKIIGPITTRQFVMFLAAAVLMAIFYQLLSFLGFIIVSVLIIAITGTFAFAKINGRPFHFFVLNLVQTLAKPRLRVWNHKVDIADKQEIKHFEYKQEQAQEEKTLQKSRLAELSLVVDTKGKYQGEENKEEVEDIEIE